MTGQDFPATGVILAAGSFGSVLHAARSISGAGGDVLVATTSGGAAVFRRSRAVSLAIDLDATDPESFIDDLVAWIDRCAPEGPIVLVPTSDRHVDLLQRARHRLPARIRPVLAPGAAVDVLLDKGSSSALAEGAGLDVAPWAVVSRGLDAAAVEHVPLPSVIRPTAWNTSGKRPFKLRRVDDAIARDQALRDGLDDGATMILQRYLQVDDDAVEFALVWTSADGSRTETVGGRKRRQSGPDGGVMVWGETGDLPDVEEAARTFVNASGFTGLGGLEVIRTEGRIWFVEFNPRLEAIHFLATRSGVDLVGLAYRDLAGLPLPAVRRRTPAAAWMGSAFVAQLSSSAGRRTAVADRLAFQRSPGRVRAICSFRDPLPSVALSARYGAAALRRLTRSVNR